MTKPGADERAVIDYLRRQWDRPLRLTTVAMGLEASGRARRPDLRLGSPTTWPPTLTCIRS